VSLNGLCNDPIKTCSGHPHNHSGARLPLDRHSAAEPGTAVLTAAACGRKIDRYHKTIQARVTVYRDSAQRPVRSVRRDPNRGLYRRLYASASRFCQVPPPLPQALDVVAMSNSRLLPLAVLLGPLHEHRGARPAIDNSRHVGGSEGHSKDVSSSVGLEPPPVQIPACRATALGSYLGF